MDHKSVYPVTTQQIQEWLELSADVQVEEETEEPFWLRVTVDEDWMDETEKHRNASFRALRQWIGQTLSNRCLFRVGQVEVDIYLLGRLPNLNWAGLKTKVVET